MHSALQLSPRGPLRLVVRPPPSPPSLDGFYAESFALERAYCVEAQARETGRRGRPVVFGCERVGSLVRFCGRAAFEFPAVQTPYACSE